MLGGRERAGGGHVDTAWQACDALPPENVMMRRMCVLVLSVCPIFVLHARHVSAPDPTRLPGPELNLTLTAPITTWDEAVPLGNGLIGGLLWGGDSTLKLSLDRGDLWDERPADGMRWELFTYANLIKKVAEKDDKYIDDVFDRAYRDTHPSKIPAGRVEIALDPGQRVERFELNLATAEGRAHLAAGARVEAFFSAVQPVALVRVPGPAPRAARLLTPAIVAIGGVTSAGPDSQGVAKLGYPPAVFGAEPGLQWYVQEAAQGMRYVVALGSRRVGDGTLYAIAVTATMDGPDPLALAKRRVRSALDAGWDALCQPHAAWWADFWSASRVTVPDADVLRQYYLVRYFHGAASRRGAPPMPLQGVWTADAGSLPPWKGDYHNDLNTQMTYMGYQGAGHVNEGLSYLDFLWDRRPRFQRFAREFYGTDGLATPGVMTLAGEPLAGWVQYSLSPTMSAWSAHLFYLHWRYTMDDAFLRERAYPWARDVGVCMLGLLKPDANGTLVLPLSSSPEVFDNTHRAWLQPNSNYDLMSLRMLFLSLTEMADALGTNTEAARWRKASDQLGPYHVRADGALKLSVSEDLPSSHRHLSNMMALHPFNLITAEGGADAARMIDASLADWDRLGTRGWCGYSFSWMSALRARVGRAEDALRFLEIYARAFILRNGFHANGDQTKSGYSGFTYRPFTLEGNFLAMNAVHEMLLQSWSATPGQRDTEVIRIFPATSARWRDALFEDLRAEGGYRVSARRENGATTWFRVTASRSGVLRVRDNFGGRAPFWNRAGVRKAGANYEIGVKAGDVIKATLVSPAGLRPPSPP
jgi:alpha-L-fucosidase 2